MKYLDEYRDAAHVHRLADAIRSTVTRPWTLMELCGGQTHSIVRFGLDSLLPPGLELVHGPGCPVCVTPVEVMDAAHAMAARPEVTFCTFGDMLRVPGTRTDLLAVKAQGGDVRMVYSPLDAVDWAARNPARQVVFFAIGFETTAPANAMAVVQARRLGLRNFSILVSQARVPPAMTMLLESPENRVQGFLAAGHVCSVMGVAEYEPIARRHRVPIVVTGFEPVDLLQGILRCVRQLESGAAFVENQYARVVRPEGSPAARQILAQVFEPVSRNWRGVGVIPDSGLALRAEWAEFDAERRFGAVASGSGEPGECISGLVLQGLRKPAQCPAFGTRCTPDHPLGATMVSGEGACAAYYRYRRSGLPEVRHAA